MAAIQLNLKGKLSSMAMHDAGGETTAASATLHKLFAYTGICNPTKWMALPCMPLRFTLVEWYRFLNILVVELR